MFYHYLKKGNVEKISRNIRVDDYFPDIAIIDEYYFFDIEIDEPYIYDTGMPIHYIGCMDESRDELFQTLGAFVIRFTENQIRSYTSDCVDIVYNMQQFSETGDFCYLKKAENVCGTIREKRWTYEDSKKMQKNNFRK